MKKTLRVLLAAAVALCALGSTNALAENREGAFTLSPMIGVHIFEGDQNLDDDLTGGLGLGYNLSQNLGVEAMFNYTDSQADEGVNPEDFDAWTMTLNGLYHFLPKSYISPYVQAGIGGIYTNSDPGDTDTNFLVDWGVGVNTYMSQNMAFRLDARHLIIGDEWDDLEHNVLLTAGLNFMFGGVQPAPAPVAKAAPAPAPAPAPVVAAAPVDSDGDGVIDSKDECPGTEAGVLVDEKGCPLSLSIHIEFDFDKAEIKPQHHDELAKAARFIKEHPAPKILVAGHTDNIGTESYNKELSQRRAEAARQYLIENYNIPADQLVARGYGESRPVATNDTAEGRQQNRRTEIICCAFIPEE